MNFFAGSLKHALLPALYLPFAWWAFSPAVYIAQKKLELFKLVKQAWNFHRLLRALREIFSDVGLSQIKFWSPNPRMPRFCKHGNEAKIKKRLKKLQAFNAVTWPVMTFLIIRLGYPVVKFCLHEFSLFCALQLLKNWFLAHAYTQKVKIVLFLFNVTT